MDSDIDDIVAKTIHTKPGPLRQDVSITQPYTPQDINILQSSGDFGQASSRRDKLSSSLARIKSSPELPPSIVPPDYSAINTSSISDDWVKRGQPKARDVEAHKRDVRQVTPLGKLKRGSSALEGSVQDNSDLVLVRNIPIDLGSCWYFTFTRSKGTLSKIRHQIRGLIQTRHLQ